MGPVRLTSESNRRCGTAPTTNWVLHFGGSATTPNLRECNLTTIACGRWNLVTNWGEVVRRSSWAFKLFVIFLNNTKNHQCLWVRRRLSFWGQSSFALPKSQKIAPFPNFFHECHINKWRRMPAPLKLSNKSDWTLGKRVGRFLSLSWLVALNPLHFTRFVHFYFN